MELCARIISTCLKLAKKYSHLNDTLNNKVEKNGKNSINTKQKKEILKFTDYKMVLVMNNLYKYNDQYNHEWNDIDT